MSAEKRKAEPSAADDLEEYLETIHGESAPKLCKLEPTECFKQIAQRAEEFEAKVLPLVKQALGYRVQWLETPKTCVQDFDADNLENCRPFPLIHFATLTMVANQKDITGRAVFAERWWCYCPTNDWIVVTTGKRGSLAIACRISDIHQVDHIFEPPRGFRVVKIKETTTE